MRSHIFPELRIVLELHLWTKYFEKFRCSHFVCHHTSYVIPFPTTMLFSHFVTNNMQNSYCVDLLTQTKLYWGGKRGVKGLAMLHLPGNNRKNSHTDIFFKISVQGSSLRSRVPVVPIVKTYHIFILTVDIINLFCESEDIHQ